MPRGPNRVVLRMPLATCVRALAAASPRGEPRLGRGVGSGCLGVRRRAPRAVCARDAPGVGVRLRVVAEDEHGDEPAADRRFAGEQVGGASGAAIAAVVGEVVGGAPLAVGFAAIGGTLGQIAGRAVSDRFVRRAPLLGEGFARGSENADPAQLPNTVDSEQVIIETVRGMMGAVDDAVVPYLGYLAGRYMLRHRRPDVFFRGMVRTLCDVDADGLRLFRAVMRAVSDDLHEAGPYPENSVIVSCFNPIVEEGGVARGVPSDDAGQAWRALDVQHTTEQALRLWQLLTGNGLAEIAGGTSTSALPQVSDYARSLDTQLCMNVERVQEILDVIDAVSEPSGGV